MKSEEKAKELVEKYQFNGDMIDDVRMSEESAVECALICVEEILETYIDLDPKLNYWKEVKKEINNL